MNAIIKRIMNAIKWSIISGLSYNKIKKKELKKY